MRIVIDLQGMQTNSRFRGIGRYTFSLVKEIIRNRKEHEIILALNGLLPEAIEDIRAGFEELLPQENIRVWEGVGPVLGINPKNKWRQAASEYIRESFLMSLKPDFLLLTTLFEGSHEDVVSSIGNLNRCMPTAIILYDLIPLIYPKVYLSDPVIRTEYHKKIEYCKNAQLWFAISDSSRLETIEYLGLKESVVINISSATDACFRPMQLPQFQQESLRKRFGLSKDYLMYLSGTDQRKNHLRLIKAYAQLPQEIRLKHQLAFVGDLPNDHRIQFVDYAAKCGLAEGELVISGYVSDHELVYLYNLCKAFVFPSWHEGFGLPVLEAMSCGCAVIASNVSSLPEVVGCSDALFDPFDEHSMTNKIEHLLTDNNFLSDLQVHGLEQSNKFSWEESSKRVIAEMEGYCDQSIFSRDDSIELCDDKKLHELLIDSIANLPYQFDDEDMLKTAKAIAQNHKVDGECQLLVDISELVQHDSKTGIQRVVRSVLSVLLHFPPEGFRVEPVYATIASGYRYARRFTAKFLNSPMRLLNDEPIEYKSGDIFLGLDLQHHIVLAHQKFYSKLQNYGVQVKFVVYDILCILMPENFYEGADKLHAQWLEIITKSDGAICISRAVADELAVWENENPHKKPRPFNIYWFHLGADIESSNPSKGMLDDARNTLEVIRKDKSFLMVGTIEPRKGYAQVLLAFEELWSKGQSINLVIVGKRGWEVEGIIEKICQHSEFGRRLFWLDGISDEYLEAVYEASSCLIAASEGEGFGLPLIEAAQNNLPILARDIPVFREVASDGAFYFSGLSSSSLANKIIEWNRLNSQGLHPVPESISWLTWKESTNQLLSCLIK